MTSVGWAALYGAGWVLAWAEGRAKEVNAQIKAEDPEWTTYMSAVCYTFLIVLWQTLYWAGWFLLYWAWNR